jgi:hypothetical protein
MRHVSQQQCLQNPTGACWATGSSAAVQTPGAGTDATLSPYPAQSHPFSQASPTRMPHACCSSCSRRVWW